MAISLDPTAEIVALRQLYRFQGEAEVVAFLRQHPVLTPLLEEVAEQIPRYFPSDTTLRLEMLDIFDDDGGPVMYAVIETTLPLPDARSRLYRFRDAWWRDATQDVFRLISTVVE